MRHWTEFTPEEAVEQALCCSDDQPRRHDGREWVRVRGPKTSDGQECPWPWDPEQLKGAPMGQYHCAYCGEMVLAGVPHTDYDNEEERHEVSD